MEKERLVIMLDFIAGPLWGTWYDKKEDREFTGIKIIDDDKKIWQINEEIQDLYSSYYKINYKDQPVYFDFEQEKKDKEKMLALFEKLMSRLNEINDGSFEIEDRETERIKKL